METLSGLYVSLTLTPDSVFKLEEAFRELPSHIGQLGMQSQHCTVMYARHSFPIKDAQMLVNYASVYHTMVDEYEVMVDHKGRNIIIAKLIVTDKLQALHNKWLNAGAEHSFSPYMAHITITSDFISDKDMGVVKAYLRVLNNMEKPFLRLSKETFEELD